MNIIRRSRLLLPAKSFHQCALLTLALAAGAAGADNAVVDQHQLGTQYSPLQQINKSNVANLEMAWEYRTGDLPPAGTDTGGMLVSFQDQPSLIEGNLVICSTKRRVIALDPATGEKRWSFDPKTPQRSMQKCRGISHWVDREAPEGAMCKSRIILGTADYHLVAIDAKTGKPCEGFGENGVVKMPPSKPELFPGEVVAGSNPAIVNDVIVVGSSVADSQRVAAPSGRVMAYHARTGEYLWEFDPVPRNPDDPAMKTWDKGTEGYGQGNVWSSMAVDQQRDLVFLPTTSASSDFYGAGRPGNNEYSTSVVALRGATGEVVWHYQLVHHNVFDYDLPARPILIDYPHNGTMVPALVQLTKMGMIFVFNRETGEPLVPIEERPVPQTGTAAGEVLSPTQPFPQGMPIVTPHGITEDDAWGFTFFDRWLCRKKIAKYHTGSIYLPASERGTIFAPSAGGGPNWGGGGYDPDSHIIVVPNNRVPVIVTLVPRETVPTTEKFQLEIGGPMRFPMPDSKYVFQVEPLLSIFGAPCVNPPWAALSAVDLVKKEIVWETPLGNIDKMAPLPISMELGTPGAGGPLVTAGGLVFIGYSLDSRFHAYDLHTGELLWQTDLPAAGNSVPISYEVNGEQYVVVPAGGHSMYGATPGDSVIAFKLKR